MKILFICGSLEPGKDGVGDYTRRLAGELLWQGHQAIAAAFNDQYVTELWKGTQESGGQNFPVQRVPSSIHYRQRIIYIKEWIDDHNPDWISIQFVPYAFSRLGMPISLILFVNELHKLSSKLTITFHELAIRYDRNPKTWLVSTVQRLIVNLLTVFSKITFTSISLYQQYLYINKKSNWLLPIGSNIPIVEVTKNDQKALRIKLGWEEGVILTYFGSNPRQLGFSFSLLRSLQEKGHDAKLLLIGSLRESWVIHAQSIIKEFHLSSSVHFTGFLPAADVFRYLKCADIYLGLFDNGISFKSGSVAAAFAAGLPIVATRGDMTDLKLGLVDGETLLFCESTNASLLTQVERLIHEPKLREKLAQNAFDFYTKKLAWEKIVVHFIARLNKMRVIAPI